MNRMKMAAFLSAACMAFTGVTASYQAPAVLTVFAEDTAETLSGECGAEGGNVTWTYDGSGTLTISGTGAMANFNSYSNESPWQVNRIYWSIKKVVINEGVTAIGDYAFYRCSAMEEITLPESLTSIGKNAFYYCEKLKSLSIPAGVSKIGESAFFNTDALESITVAAGNADYCAKDSVLYDKEQKTLIRYPAKKAGTAYVIPDTVETVGGMAFDGCNSLTDITLPDNLKTLSGEAFQNCQSLTEIAIPDSVTSLGTRVFYGCKNLAKITVGANNEKYCAVDSVIFTKNMKTLLCYAPAKPEISFVIPDTVTRLEESSLAYTQNLTEVTIPDALTDISSYAFAYSQKLAKAAIPANLRSAGSNMFYYCAGLTEYTLPDGMKEIPSYMFGYCENLKKVTIPDSVTKIGYSAFYHCGSLEEIVIPENVTFIGSSTFYGCTALKEVVVPDGVEKIEYTTFTSCSALESVTIKNSECEIYDSKSTIAEQAVIYGVADSTAQAYAEKYGREFMEIGQTVLPPASGTFGENDCLKWDYDGNGTLTISGEGNMPMFSSYESASSPMAPWKRCKRVIQHVVVAEGVKNIGENAFYQCSKMTDISLPDSLEGLGYSCFYGCESLQKIVIPAGVKELNTYSFCGCKSLVSIEAAADHPEFSSKDGLLYNKDMTTLVCYPIGKAVGKVTIPEGVTGLGFGAFDYCTEMQTLRLPDSLKELNSSSSSSVPIYGCEKLTAFEVGENNENYCAVDGVLFSKEGKRLIRYPIGREGAYVVPDGSTGIAPYAFSQTQKLTEVTIPDSVKLTVWDYSIFSYCSSLASVRLPAGLEVIPSNMFEYCYGLKSITLPDSLHQIGYAAFRDSGLTSINLPNGLFLIDEYAFNTSSLQAVTIPASVGYVDFYQSFNYGMYLQSVTVLNPYCVFNGTLDKAVITGYTGSTAEKYAAEHGMKFVALESEIPEIIASGDCGDEESDLKWWLSKDHVLTFSGTGGMHNYNYMVQDPNPWHTFGSGSQLTHIEFDKNVKNVNMDLFYQLNDVLQVTFWNPEIIVGQYEYQDVYMPDNVVIYGYEESTAHEFANRNNLKFVALEGNPPRITTPPVPETTTAATTTTTVTTTTAVTTTTTVTTTTEPVTTTTAPNQPAYKTVEFDEETGTLTLKGEVDKEEVWAFVKNEAVKKVVCAEGTVLPENCAYLFSKVAAESIDLSNADSSRVTNMEGMFEWCDKLTALNLSGLDTSNVTTMDNMFRQCYHLTELDVSGFNTSNVVWMDSMFNNCSSLTELDLSCFDTSNVEHMEEMFRECHNLTKLNISGFDTSNTCYFGDMFFYCVNLTELDVSHFNTSRALNMYEMFFNCYSLTELDVSGFDTSHVKNMGGMFAGCVKLTKLDVSGFDTSNVSDFGWMFDGCAGLTELDVSRFDTSKAENMELMFSHCSGLKELDLSSFDTSKVKDMDEMFEGSDDYPTNLKKIYVSDKWSTESVEGSDKMFKGCTELTGGSGTKFDAGHTDSEYARIDTADAPGYFTAKGDKPEQPPVTTAVKGDADGDGEISNRDTMLLVRYVNGWEGIDIDLSAADIDGDGEVSSKDAMIIVRYVNGWEGYDRYFK